MTKAEYQKLYLENKKFKEKMENIEKNNNNISREKIDQRSVIEKYQKKRKYMEVEREESESEPDYEEEKESKENLKKNSGKNKNDGTKGQIKSGEGKKNIRIPQQNLTKNTAENGSRSNF